MQRATNSSTTSYNNYLVIPRIVFLRWFVRAFSAFLTSALLLMLAPKSPPTNFAFFVPSDLTLECLTITLLLCAIVCAFSLALYKFSRRNRIRKGVLFGFIAVTLVMSIQSYRHFSNILSIDTAYLNQRLYNLAWPDVQGGSLLYECTAIGVFCRLVDRNIYSGVHLEIAGNQVNIRAGEYSLVRTYQP